MKLVLLILIIFSTHSSSEESSTSKLIDELFKLNSEIYTGGLHKKNRDLAHRIRESMKSSFPEQNCEEHDPMQGVLIGNIYDGNEKISLDTSKILNNNLRKLIEALNKESQEIRDTATFTLSLFGPSIQQVVPYIEIKRSNDSIQGNWYNHALSEIDCVNWAPANFKRVIPSKLLPSEEPWVDYLNKVSIILTEFYFNPDIEYPPEMLNESFSNYGFSKNDQRVVKMLFDLLINESLSDQKRIEAARTLTEFDIEKDSFMSDKLIPLLNYDNLELTQSIEDLIIELQHPYGIVILSSYLKDEVFWGWDGLICDYGIKAIDLEDGLIRTLSTYKNSSSKIGNIHALGCIKSKKSISTLLELAQSQDWEIAIAAIESIGLIEVNSWKVRRVLKKISKDSWSQKLRDAAKSSLHLLSSKQKHEKKDEDTSDDKLEVIVRLGPYPTNHGLPWCNDKGKYSLNGKKWFHVDWKKEGLPKAPKNFPKDLLTDRGTHTFYKVEDGWLFGSEKGHYDGAFIFWSNVQQPYYLTNSFTDIYSIFEHNNKIKAIGYQVLSSKDAGVLFEISKANGKWEAKKVATLPSPPFGYAFGPNNELLISDGPNDYAVIDNKIIPLKCELEFEGSYFK